MRRTTGIVQRALSLEANEALGEDTNPSLRLAAEVFEHLAELKEGPDRETSVMLAAGLFQISRVRRKFLVHCKGDRTQPTPKRIYLRCRGTAS